MRTVLMGLLLCVPSLYAQEEKPPSPRERYEALLKEYEAAEEGWNKRYDAGATDDTKVDWVARYRYWPGWSFAPRFVRLAEENPGDDAAVDALMWVVDRAMNVGVADRELVPAHRRALDLLARGGHLDDKRVGQACRRALTYDSPAIERFLREILEKGKDHEIRGQACLALAKVIARRMVAKRAWFEMGAKSPLQVYSIERFDPDYLKYIRDADSHKLNGEAQTQFEVAARDYGDILYRRAPDSGGRDLTIADVARSELHELRDLAIGKVAPEIEGEDIDGKPLRLGDHRGKVVVLTFWASWCGPCMGLVPSERALVERLKGKPFVLLGINGDEDREQARTVVERERITWRSFWNGGPRGPITEQWNVHRWPTVYVLDGKGVIRFKEVIKDGLDEAVDKLLDEMEEANAQ